MTISSTNPGGRYGVLGHRRHDVLDALADGRPMTVDEVCDDRGTDQRDARESLGALVSMGLAEVMSVRSEANRRRKVRMYLITRAGSNRLLDERDKGNVPGVPPRRVREIMKRRAR